MGRITNMKTHVLRTFRQILQRHRENNSKQRDIIQTLRMTAFHETNITRVKNWSVYDRPYPMYGRMFKIMSYQERPDIMVGEMRHIIVGSRRIKRGRPRYKRCHLGHVQYPRRTHYDGRALKLTGACTGGTAATPEMA